MQRLQARRHANNTLAALLCLALLPLLSACLRLTDQPTGTFAQIPDLAGQYRVVNRHLHTKKLLQRVNERLTLPGRVFIVPQPNSDTYKIFPTHTGFSDPIRFIPAKAINRYYWLSGYDSQCCYLGTLERSAGTFQVHLWTTSLMPPPELEIIAAKASLTFIPGAVSRLSGQTSVEQLTALFENPKFEKLIEPVHLYTFVPDTPEPATAEDKSTLLLNAIHNTTERVTVVSAQCTLDTFVNENDEEDESYTLVLSDADTIRLRVPVDDKDATAVSKDLSRRCTKEPGTFAISLRTWNDAGSLAPTFRYVPSPEPLLVPIPLRQYVKDIEKQFAAVTHLVGTTEARTEPSQSARLIPKGLDMKMFMGIGDVPAASYAKFISRCANGCSNAVYLADRVSFNGSNLIYLIKDIDFTQ